MSNPKSVLLVGGTGLVGRTTLNYLCASQKFSKVILLSRRPLGDLTYHPKVEVVVLDFFQVWDYKIKRQLKSDVVIFCAGTTMAEAKTKEKFKEVDYEFPIRIASIAKENGTSEFLLISSIGASEKSKFFYTRTKGEVEKAILNYSFDSTSILRPSLLLGKRKKNRLGESIGAFLDSIFSPLLVGRFKKYRGIKIDNVAKALVNLAWEGNLGKRIYESDEIVFMAEKRYWVN